MKLVKLNEEWVNPHHIISIAGVVREGKLLTVVELTNKDIWVDKEPSLIISEVNRKLNEQGH